MSAPLPSFTDQLKPKLPKFTAWLRANGSAIYAPTNPWEVLRFDTPEGVGVIYKDKADALSYVGGASHAMGCWQNGNPWRACERGKLSKGERRHLRLVRSVAAADGWTCCYCGKLLDETTATLEHFVSLTVGGPDHLANMTLACGPCNAEASHLSVRRKIDIAVGKRRSS